MCSAPQREGGQSIIELANDGEIRDEDEDEDRTTLQKKKMLVELEKRFHHRVSYPFNDRICSTA